jgi:Glucose / Sorbosone dehydrogenase
MLAQIVLFFYFAFCLVCLCLLDYRQRSSRYIALVVIGIGLGILALVAQRMRGENLIQSLLFGWYAEGRVGFFTRIAALGIGAFSATSLFATSSNHRSMRWLQLAFLAIGVGSISLLLFRETLSGLISDPDASVTSGLLQVSSAKGVRVQRIELPFHPTSVVTGANADEVFVAGYTGAYLQGGAVYRYDFSKKEVPSKRVAEGFTRPHGLGWHQGDLFVSRAGQFSRAEAGRMIQERTGAVTRIKDLDQDGVYDHYEDIVKSLPGAQLPDGLHQNNGIEIAGEKLYITVGVSTDHTPAVLDTEGTILRCNLDGTEVETFAQGLRNPYGITLGPLGKIYVTDNDPNFAELGDKLCMAEQGSNLRYPYDSIDGVTVEGGTAPLKRFSSAQGISYVPKEENNQWADRILMAAYGDNALSAIRIIQKDSSAEKYEVQSEFIAKINQIVDTHYAAKNVAYACSYAEKALYRIEFDPVP